jgi:hypothetical protein
MHDHLVSRSGSKDCSTSTGEGGLHGQLSAVAAGPLLLVFFIACSQQGVNFVSNSGFFQVPGGGVSCPWGAGGWALLGASSLSSLTLMPCFHSSSISSLVAACDRPCLMLEVTFMVDWHSCTLLGTGNVGTAAARGALLGNGVGGASQP